MSVNPEDWDVDFAFPDFNLALFEWEWSWCRNWIVTFPWKGIWSVFENFNTDHTSRREWTGRNLRCFPQKINKRILRQWPQTYLEKLLCLLKCFFFFTRTNGGKMEMTSRKTQCPVSKILQHYIKELKLTALLVLTKYAFSMWRICFHFLGNPLLCAIVFMSQWKLSFLMPVKWLSNRASCTCFQSPKQEEAI